MLHLRQYVVRANIQAMETKLVGEKTPQHESTDPLDTGSRELLEACENIMKVKLNHAHDK